MTDKMSLFDNGNEPRAEQYQPLAARMRPVRLNDVLGQAHLLSPGMPLTQAIETSALHSMILWGPPGVGKTTIARLIAKTCNVHFQSISAVLAGVKEIREAIALAKQQRQFHGEKTLLFVDEAHRFNRAQQDAFLPYIEDGTLIFVGATTENPSFELNNALLSRVRVYKLKLIESAQLVHLMRRALSDTRRGLGAISLTVADDILHLLARAADGDGRRALNLLEISADLASNGRIDTAVIAEVLGSDYRRFDKGGDIFYEQISALHKAVRGSAPDAALYWFARMLDGGCDPLYIARRVLRIASEDIGIADPRGQQLALQAWEVQERLGSPEGELSIAQAIVYLAIAAKSNAVYQAFAEASRDAAEAPAYAVPMHLRNAPTGMMQNLGYGAEYNYAHDFEQAFVPGENYFPAALHDRIYYQPVARGLEIQIKEKLEMLRAQNKASQFQRYVSASDTQDKS